MNVLYWLRGKKKKTHTQGYYGHQNAPSSTFDYPDETVERPSYRYAAPTSDIPDVIKQFIQYFHNSIKEGRLYEIQDLYENTFPKLSEEYFDRSPWPDENSIAYLVEGDRVSVCRIIRKIGSAFLPNN